MQKSIPQAEFDSVLVETGDGVDFDKNAFGQGSNLDCGAGGWGFVEEFAVEVGDEGEVLQIGQKKSGFDDIFEFVTGLFEDRAQIGKHQMNLRFDAVWNFSSGRINGDLSGAVERSFEFNSLCVGPYRFRRGFFFVHCFEG